jgi:hypothetical protein
MGQRYAFFGGTLLRNRKTWFVDQLQHLIALLPADRGHQLRGLFIATDADGTSQWRIRGRQVLTGPTPPRFEYFSDTPCE